MTNENKCPLARKCKRAGQELYCNDLCFPYVRMLGESGNGGVMGVASIPKAYSNSRADNLPFKDDNPTAYKTVLIYCKDVVGKVDEGVGLYLFGVPNAENRKGTGNGKTTAATAILNEYLTERVILETKKERGIVDVPALFVNVSKFQNAYNAQFRGSIDAQSEASDVYYRMKGRMMKVPLLVMDDIGIRDATEAFKNEFYEVIDERASEVLATIYTSNVPIEKIADILDDRIASRIEGTTYPVPFGGADKRKKGL
jgi:DNA replication protein DnaC